MPKASFVSKNHPRASANAQLRDFQTLPFYLTNYDTRTNRIYSIRAKQQSFP